MPSAPPWNWGGKDLRRQDAFVRGGGWEEKSYHGHELRGRRLGLVGIGMIGRILARMADSFGMSVTAYDPFAPDEAFGPHVARQAELDALLAESDVVSLHCPLTDQTHSLIGTRELGLMKPSALLINTARGEVVNEAALVAALNTGVIAGAGLDSFSPEPPLPDNPLWSLDNVIVSPHVGGVTEEARREVSITTVGNVLAVLNGEPVNPRCCVTG